MNIWDRHRARFPEKIQSTDGPAFWIFFQVSRIRVKRTGLALYLYLLFYILDKFCLKDPIRKLLKEKNNWINRTENPRKSENFCSSKSQILVSESFLPNITKDEVKKLLHFDEIKGNKKSGHQSWLPGPHRKSGPVQISPLVRLFWYGFIFIGKLSVNIAHIGVTLLF